MEYFCYRAMTSEEEQFAGPKLMWLMNPFYNVVPGAPCSVLAVDALEYSFSGAPVVWDSLEVMQPMGW
jgi:hypothetical protein